LIRFWSIRVFVKLELSGAKAEMIRGAVVS
jgi:hypothetical protein